MPLLNRTGAHIRYTYHYLFMLYVDTFSRSSREQKKYERDMVMINDRFERPLQQAYDLAESKGKAGAIYDLAVALHATEIPRLELERALARTNRVKQYKAYSGKYNDTAGKIIADMIMKGEEKILRWCIMNAREHNIPFGQYVTQYPWMKDYLTS